MISLPNWSQARLIREAIADFNLRHSDSSLDAKSSDWPILCRTIHKFIRHRLTDYEEQLATGYNPALREKLVAEMGKAAAEKYPWLRLERDPRCEDQGQETDKPAFNQAAAYLADFYTQKNRILGALAELKRKGGSRAQQQEFRQQLAEIEAQIRRGQEILLEPIYNASGCSPKIYLLGPIEVGKRHFFGPRKLSPNHVAAETFACPGCGERIWRSKRPIDLGQGKSAVFWICGCIFYGLPPAPPGMKMRPLKLGDWLENLEEISRRNASQ
jgi:hypothetical protein